MIITAKFEDGTAKAMKSLVLSCDDTGVQHCVKILPAPPVQCLWQLSCVSTTDSSDLDVALHTLTEVDALIILQILAETV